jgi:acetyl esterase/lipase
MSRLLVCALLTLLVSFVPGGGLPPPVNDIPYGDYHPDLLFDWYPPAASTGHDPALLFIHGGQPPYGDKQSVLTDYPQLLELARLNGIGVFSAEFRPYPEYTYPSQLQDVQLALQFLRENAATYGLDPQRIGLWGHSAGGIMGGWMSYGEDAADPLGTPVQQQSSRPNIFLAFSCITDFTLLVPWFTGSFFGQDFLGQVDPQLLQETSATWQICNVPREFTPPVYSLFGQTYNLPPLVDAHDAYFGEALHKALRACEPQVESLSIFDIRDKPLAELTREQLEWIMVCFGMEGPAQYPQHK